MFALIPPAHATSGWHFLFNDSKWSKLFKMLLKWIEQDWFKFELLYLRGLDGCKVLNCVIHSKWDLQQWEYNGSFPWNMLMTFMHAYRPCWLANTIELCTKQTRYCVCVTHPLAVYKTAPCSLILPTKTSVRTRYVQFTNFKFHGKGLLGEVLNKRHE